jgi:hypothetical protein
VAGAHELLFGAADAGTRGHRFTVLHADPGANPNLLGWCGAGRGRTLEP